MAKSKISEVNSFASKHKGDNRGVAHPSMNGAGNAAPGNAANVGKPANPGGLNLLKKIKADGSFKTSN